MVELLDESSKHFDKFRFTYSGTRNHYEYVGVYMSKLEEALDDLTGAVAIQ